MIYLQPTKYKMEQNGNDLHITFTELKPIVSDNDIGDVTDRMRCVAGILGEQQGHIIKGARVSGNDHILLNAPDYAIGSSLGFNDIVKGIFSYNINYNDTIYLKLVKTEMVAELKKAADIAGIKLKQTIYGDIVDTIIYNWLAIVVTQNSRALEVVKYQRKDKKVPMRPKLISSGMQIMEITLM